MDAKLFVNNIIALRKSFNISQPQLANTLNTSIATISKWERQLLKTMPDNKAIEIFEKLKKVSNFPSVINLEMFLKSDLNEILKYSKTRVYDNLGKHKINGLHPGLFDFLNDVKIMTLNQPTQEEIEKMKWITFAKQAQWVDKYFYVDVLFHIRLAGAEK